MPRPSTLSSADYRALLRDIKTLATQSKRQDLDRKLNAYWAMGKRITDEKISSESGYFAAVVGDLSSDVGLARRTLYEAIQFFEAYSAPPLDSDLNWSHHRALLRIGSKKERSFYAKKALSENWSVRELQAAIASGLHETGLGKTQLERPSDQSYVYETRVFRVVDGDTLDLDIDLGFGVARKLRARLANINAPELSRPKGRDARDFVVEQLMGAQTCVVKTIRVDLHGRYVVHFFFTRNQTTVTSCFESGSYLNELMLQSKHARYMPS